jgi:hypothetical protein
MQDILSTANRRVFLWTLIIPHHIPTKYQRSQERVNKDANDDIAIVIHRKQHDEISHAKLQHVQERSNKLLLDVWLAWPSDEKAVPGAG